MGIFFIFNRVDFDKCRMIEWEGCCAGFHAKPDVTATGVRRISGASQRHIAQAFIPGLKYLPEAALT
jgi:hypothetical protein